jgi:acyl-CoA reductase-like NAD-dependent aldehyde dehydrogenase
MLKTYKLYVNGAFIRSESGATLVACAPDGKVLAHVASASRKDLRDAVAAARSALDGWIGASAYLRGQILYRMAEMVEGRREELAEAIDATRAKARAPGARQASSAAGTARREVDATVDRLVAFAGWTDKFGHVLGCHDPVAGPYYTFTVPEAVGVVVVVAPEEPALLGLVTLMAAPLCAGCTVVAIAGDRHPLPPSLLGEVLATSDVPRGAANVLIAKRGALLEHVARHRDVDAVVAAGVDAKEATLLRSGTADNLKRVHVIHRTGADWLDERLCTAPEEIHRVLEMKTIWHPAAT